MPEPRTREQILFDAVTAEVGRGHITAAEGLSALGMSPLEWGLHAGGGMKLIVNGQVVVNGRLWWRIDDAESGLTGLEMLANPFALAMKREDADAIVKALSAPEKT